MKKIISLVSILFLSIMVVACSKGLTDEEAVNEAYGSIILGVDKYNVKADFYLSKTTLANEVSVVWESDHAAITITKENAKLAEDDKEYEYFKAVVTQPLMGTADQAVNLKATLTKGKASKVFEEKVKVIADDAVTGTIAEIKAKEKGTVVRVKGVVVSRGVNSAQYKNFPAYVQDETGALMVYRIKGDFYDNFAVGNEVEISATLDNYSGLLQVKDVSKVKVLGTKTVPAVTDITGVSDLLPHQNKVVKLTGNYFVKTNTDGKKVFVDLYNTTSKVITAVADVDNLPDFETKKEAVLALNGKVLTSIEGIMGWYKAGQITITDLAKIVTRDTTESEKGDADVLYDMLDIVVPSTTSKDLTLPVSGTNGSTIAWSSNNTAAISNDGKVTQGADDVVVKLTATITKADKNLTKEFTVTVEKKVTGPVTSTVIINELYGGGGNTGAALKHDFVELYNTTDADINISGWSLQYASATGAFGSYAGNTFVFPEGAIIKAKSYILVQGASGSVGTDLVGADFVAQFNMGGKEGKLALANNDTKVEAITSSNIVDFVGFGPTASMFFGTGPTPILSNTTSGSRTNFVDTKNNAADFTAGALTPTNAAGTTQTF